MAQKEEINNFIADYLEQYNGDSYEAYAEKEDIARACQDAIEWADRTMIERVCEFIKKRFTETIVGNVISKHETTINEVINDFREYIKEE